MNDISSIVRIYTPIEPILSFALISSKQQLSKFDAKHIPNICLNLND